jgi:two-component system invasion response regulator UvrY
MHQLNVPIKIAVADDHGLFRAGIIKLLDPAKFQLVFDVENGKALIEKFEGNKALIPDIVIIDIRMPGMNGYETVAWIQKNHPFVRVLVVSDVDQEESIVRMVQLGVKGYLSKVMEPEDLHAALKALINNEYYFTDIATNRLIHYIQKNDDVSEVQTSMVLVNDLWKKLNSGQKEFIKYACSTDLTYEEIAAKMLVSPKTIDGYREVVFDRFNVRNRVGLVLYAIKNSIVTI